MHDSITWVGIDVHKESILVAAVNRAGATAARWETPNTSLKRVARADAMIEEEAQKPEIAPVVGRLKALRGMRTLTAISLLA